MDNAAYIRDVLDVPGCRLALRVDREVRKADGELVSHDVRYFVSSLDPERVTAVELLKLVRDHWRVENGLHFVKDRWWDEDRHHQRRPGLASCLTALNSLALSIHRLFSNPALPLRAAADHVAWTPQRGLSLLNS